MHASSALAGGVAAACRLQQHPEPAPAAGRAGRTSAAPGGIGARASARDRSRIWRRPPATACSSPSTSADITPEAQQILQRQADWLRRYPNVTVTIEGHCDERGTREYNLALGERRAQAVKNVLVALGIPAARISTISYGKERPAVPAFRRSSPMRRTAAASRPSIEGWVRLTAGSRLGAEIGCRRRIAPIFRPKPGLVFSVACAREWGCPAHIFPAHISRGSAGCSDNRSCRAAQTLVTDNPDSGTRRGRQIEVDVVGDEQIEAAVTVVVEERAARAPARAPCFRPAASVTSVEAPIAVL